MSLTLGVAIFGVFFSPVVSALVAFSLVKRSERQRDSDGNRTQDIALARLEEKVDSIPERMNGKIAKAIEAHHRYCAMNSRGTDPRIPVYNGPINPDEE